MEMQLRHLSKSLNDSFEEAGELSWTSDNRLLYHYYHCVNRVKQTGLSVCDRNRFNPHLTIFKIKPSSKVRSIPQAAFEQYKDTNYHFGDQGLFGLQLCCMPAPRPKDEFYVSVADVQLEVKEAGEHKVEDSCVAVCDVDKVLPYIREPVEKEKVSGVGLEFDESSTRLSLIALAVQEGQIFPKRPRQKPVASKRARRKTLPPKAQPSSSKE